MFSPRDTILVDLQRLLRLYFTAAKRLSHPHLAKVIENVR